MTRWRPVAPLRIRSALALLTTCTALLPAPALAEGLLLGGFQVATRAPYAYLGTILPLPGQNLGNGWTQRYWLDGFGYEYDSGVNLIQATAFGLDAMIGRVASSEQGYGAVYLGARVQSTNTSPNDPGNPADGTNLGLKAQIEGEHALDRTWRINGIANYTTNTSDYWMRGRLLRGLESGRFVGPEVIYQGNPDYHLVGIGVVLGGIRPAGGALSFSVKGGYQNTSTGGGAYGGIELVYPY